MWTFAGLFCAILALSCDIHYVWRYYLVLFFCKMRRKHRTKGLLDENEFKVICLPTDVSFRGTMTMGRLLRECEIGQHEFRVENYLHDVIERLGGQITNEQCHVTYIQPIKIFETFTITAEIFYWDRDHFYIEQKVILNEDQAICAVITTRQRLVNISTDNVISHLPDKPQQPILSEEIQKKLSRLQTIDNKSN